MRRMMARHRLTLALAPVVCALALLPALLSACAPTSYHSSATSPAHLNLAATARAPVHAAPPLALAATPATTPTPAPPVSASEALLVDPETGRALFAANADTEMPMASTTKIMTALVALSFGQLDQRITVGADAAALSGTEASVAGLQQGETYTLHELLYALLLPSGDDAAVAIADGVAGSQDRFVRLMNLEATLLGLGHTHYADVHGLDAPGHYTTPRDLAKLTEVALRSPVFAQIVATAQYSVPATAEHAAHTWTTTNLLLSTEPYRGVMGVKTGFTGGAGYCLVFYATRPYGQLLGVVLGEPNEQARFDDAAALLTWGFGQLRASAVALPDGWISHAG